MRLKDRQKAIEFRKMGMSYSEIMEAIPNLSKGTLSHWISRARLTTSERKFIDARLSEKVSAGRLKAAQTLREKKQKKLKAIEIEGDRLFKKYKKEKLFRLGIVLYWAEGAKTTERISFMNSDVSLITLMTKWFLRYFSFPSEKYRLRLFAHEVYKNEKCEIYWQALLPFDKSQYLQTVYKPSPHTKKRNKAYKGCLRIDAGGVEEFYLLKRWQTNLAKEMNIIPHGESMHP